MVDVRGYEIVTCAKQFKNNQKSTKASFEFNIIIKLQVAKNEQI